jgi:hypothetical protein
MVPPSSKQVRVYAVKLAGDGWVGVGVDLGRCHGHGHETPELAKLCALHRLGAPAPGGDVVLLPLPASGRREGGRIARASG